MFLMDSRLTNRELMENFDIRVRSESCNDL